jgi:hypothetical protein
MIIPIDHGCWWKKTVLPSGMKVAQSTPAAEEIVPGAKTCGWGGAAITAPHARNSDAMPPLDSKTERRAT